MDQARKPLSDIQQPDAPLPAGACDCHAHIYGGRDEYALAPTRGFDPAPGSLGDYVRAYSELHRKLGFERGVLVHSNAYGTDNSVTTDAVARLGEGHKGIALVQPDISEQEMSKLASEGIKGIRLNLVSPDAFDLQTVKKRANEYIELGWHLEVIMKVADLPRVADDLASLPLEVVIDHHGLPDVTAGTNAPGFSTLVELVRESKVWVKATAVYRFSQEPYPHDDTREFTEALVEANPSRVLWGTDWPHVLYGGPMPDEGALLNQFLSILTDPQTVERIMVSNPEALYGFA